MAPTASATLLSPAELSYLHTSLSLNPPIRPDGRLPTQFRSLIAETDILPGTNGSARICFADGTEAIAGVKAEVEKTPLQGAPSNNEGAHLNAAQQDEEMDDIEEEGAALGKKGMGQNKWVDVTIEIPGYRDDDALPVFLSAMLSEALLATRDLVDKLWINTKWHWRLYIDILLLSPPLSYPIPLLSCTTHLALLSTNLPALKSEGDEDPLFNDDWAASIPLYPLSSRFSSAKKTVNQAHALPPVTLLIAAVGSNILFDPSQSELVVADAVLAISINSSSDPKSSTQLLSVRTVDPPSRLTPPGVLEADNPSTSVGANSAVTTPAKKRADHEKETNGVWSPPRGGMKRPWVSRVLEIVLEKGGVGEDVLTGLGGFVGY